MSRRGSRPPDSEQPWVTVRAWTRTFENQDVETYSVLQSRKNPLLFAATRSFVAGGFEQDYEKEHRAADRAEADLILRNPESFHRRMAL
jgi:hypothetical protein